MFAVQRDCVSPDHLFPRPRHDETVGRERDVVGAVVPLDDASGEAMKRHDADAPLVLGVDAVVRGDIVAQVLDELPHKRRNRHALIRMLAKPVLQTRLEQGALSGARPRNDKHLRRTMRCDRLCVPVSGFGAFLDAERDEVVERLSTSSSVKGVPSSLMSGTKESGSAMAQAARVGALTPASTAISSSNSSDGYISFDSFIRRETCFGGREFTPSELHTE